MNLKQKRYVVLIEIVTLISAVFAFFSDLNYFVLFYPILFFGSFFILNHSLKEIRAIEGKIPTKEILWFIFSICVFSVVFFLFAFRVYLMVIVYYLVN